MGWGILQKPGSSAGPCVEACIHEDCKATREMAEAPCTYCGKEIGYDTKFYKVGPELTDLAHAVCVWEEQEGK